MPTTARPVREPGRVVILLSALLAIAIVAGVFAAHDRARSTDLAHGAASAPPWPAPTDRVARATAADLPNVYGEKLAEHIHTHLTITVAGQPVTVPGQIGLNEKKGFATALHTHNTSGIVHIESPVRRDFTLGQFFTEWNVRLDAHHVGSLGGRADQALTVFVDGQRRYGDPASIRLRDLDDIDLVIARPGQTVKPSAPFDWPSNYH